MEKWQDKVRGKSIKRGLCQRCGLHKSTARIALLVQEKAGDAASKDGSTTRRQQKFIHVDSKATTLCDECVVIVYTEVRAKLSQMVD